MLLIVNIRGDELTWCNSIELPLRKTFLRASADYGAALFKGFKLVVIGCFLKRRRLLVIGCGVLRPIDFRRDYRRQGICRHAVFGQELVRLGADLRILEVGRSLRPIRIVRGYENSG